MIQTVTYESVITASKVAAYIGAILAVPIALKYAIADIRKDHARSAEQITVIGEKVDTIHDTLATMQVNAARHDQRAADIQERVKSIDGRVTFLEQRTSR